MAATEDNAHQLEVALIVGGGPGISASCARLFVREGMTVAVAARNPGNGTPWAPFSVRRGHVSSSRERDPVMP